MGVVFGLLAALGITASDLFSRRLTRINGPVAAGAILHIIATFICLAAVGVVESTFGWRDVVLGGLSGLGLACGLGCYLAGLQRSSAAIVSPLAAAGSAVVPFAYALSTGANASSLAYVGAALAVGGILITSGSGFRASKIGSGIRWGVGSGAGYGFGLTVLLEVSASSGVWPAVSQRFVAAAVMSALALVMQATITPPVELRLAALAGGVAVALSTVFYLMAIDVNVVAAVVASSTYPIGTVAIGRGFFGDEVRPLQVVGVVVTVLGIVAIAIG